MLFVISTNDPSKKNMALESLSGSTELTEEDSVLEAEKELDNLVKRVDEDTDEVNVWDELTSTGALVEKEKKWGLLWFFNFWKDNESENDSEPVEIDEGLPSQEDIGWTADTTEEVTIRTVGNSGSLDSENIDSLETEKESLFDKLFGKKTSSWETLEWDVDENEEKEVTTDSDIKQQDEVKQEEVVKETVKNVETKESSVKNVWGNMSKTTGGNTVLSNASMSYMHQYPKELVDESLMYPGLKLKTAIGKYFEVGVHMLKLNNANFNMKLALMNKWDRLKQLTHENKYGCFLIEIAEAKDKANIGKKWYVCKKYLQKASKGKKVHMSPTKVKKETQVVEVIHSDSFLPEDDKSNSVVPEESFLPEDDASNSIVPNSSSSSANFALPQEVSAPANESFLPEEPITVPSSGESFLPEEPIIINSEESFLPEEDNTEINSAE